MKKYFLPILFIGLIFNLPAQQLSNSGFENWTLGNPNNWGSYDALLSTLGVPGTTLETQVSPGNTGNSACQLKTQTIVGIGQTTSGVICTGPLNFSGNQFSFGLSAYSSIPSSYSFYYKFSPVLGDVAGTYAFFTKWNSAINKRDTIGFASYVINSPASSFTQTSVPIIWTIPGAVPDSISLIFFSSAGGNPQPNTTLILDDISMDFTTGEKEPFTFNEYDVYPNPVSEMVNFATKNKSAKTIEIFDFSGKLIERNELSEGKITINTSNYQEGGYLYRIVDSDGKILKSNKISVIR